MVVPSADIEALIRSKPVEQLCPYLMKRSRVGLIACLTGGILVHPEELQPPVLHKRVDHECRHLSAARIAEGGIEATACEVGRGIALHGVVTSSYAVNPIELDGCRMARGLDPSLP